VPYAQKVRWLHAPSVGLSQGMEKLEFLERLTQFGSLPEPLFDYRRLPRLRQFACDIAALLPRDYLNHPNIEALDLEGLKSADLSFLSDAKRLRALRLVGGSLKRADGLADYAELRELRLLLTRGLTDISALAGAVNLDTLELEGTPKVADISPIHRLSQLRRLFIHTRNAKQDDLAWLANMPRLECAMIMVQTATIDWDIFARLPRLYDIAFYAHEGYVAEPDEVLTARLSAHGKQVREIKRFPKDRFPGFVIRFAPPADIARPMPAHVYKNHLRYKLAAPDAAPARPDAARPKPAPAPVPELQAQDQGRSARVPPISATTTKEIALSAMPKEILPDTAWSFDGSVFDDRAKFSDEVREYQIDIVGEDAWRPHDVVLPLPRVLVAYEHWDDEGDQVETVLDLESKDGKHFTALDLLFQVHNAVVEDLCDDDHHFFEGLTLEPEASCAHLPRYSLRLGS
jgi:hypothetical protein